MGYLGRRIGKSQDQGDSNPGGADGAVGGGILDLFANGYFERQGDIYNAPGVGPTEMVKLLVELLLTMKVAVLNIVDTPSQLLVRLK